MFSNKKFHLSSSRNFATSQLAPYVCIQVCCWRWNPGLTYFTHKFYQRWSSRLSLTPSETVCCVYSLAQHWTHPGEELLNHSCSTAQLNGNVLNQGHTTKTRSPLFHITFFCFVLFLAFLSLFLLLNVGCRFLAVLITRWGQLVPILFMILIS